MKSKDISGSNLINFVAADHAVNKEYAARDRATADD